MRSSITQPLLMAVGSALLYVTPLPSSLAATAPKVSTPDSRYQMERERCLNGSSHQDRATCLKEAAAARAEARRQRLDNGESAQRLAENRVARCQAQPEPDRARCVRMATGEGTSAGSVEGGGVIRELVTREVGPAPASN